MGSGIGHTAAMPLFGPRFGLAGRAAGAGDSGRDPARDVGADSEASCPSSSEGASGAEFALLVRPSSRPSPIERLLLVGVEFALSFRDPVSAAELRSATDGMTPSNEPERRRREFRVVAPGLVFVVLATGLFRKGLLRVDEKGGRRSSCCG